MMSSYCAKKSPLQVVTAYARQNEELFTLSVAIWQQIGDETATILTPY
jgi:hypothetical protein